MNASTEIEQRRFYVPTDTCGTLEGGRIALSWLMLRAPDFDGEPLVIVPTVGHARSNEFVTAATERFQWQTALAYKSARAHGWRGGPTLLLYPDDRVLDRFDRSPLVSALCVVQGVRYDTTAWAKAYGPEDLTTGQRYPKGPDIDKAPTSIRPSNVRSGASAGRAAGTA